MIYLKHTPSNGINIKTPFKEYFYDGAVDIINSVCEVPDDKLPWVLHLEGLSFVRIDEIEFRQARGLPAREIPRQPR